MKFKKTLVLIVAIFCATIFVGCGRNVQSPAIKVSRYFNNSVSYTYTTNRTEKLNLSSFTKNSVDNSTVGKQSTIQLTGENQWVYRLYVECIYFYFYCNQSVDIEQLVVTMTNLDSGTFDSTLPTGTYKKSTILAFKAKQNKGVLLRVDINQTIVSSSADCLLTLKLEHDELLSSSNDFKWSIYDLAIYGKTAA